MSETHQERHERLAQGQRADQVQELLAQTSSEEAFFRTVAMLLMDAALEGDEVTLETGLRELQRAYAASENMEERGRYLGLIDMVRWASQRSPSLVSVAEFEVSSHAHEFLQAVAETPGLWNGELASRLGTSDAEVSRLGGRLVEARVAVKRRIGRRNYWDITPRGLQMLDLLDQGGVSRHQRSHRVSV